MSRKTEEAIAKRETSLPGRKAAASEQRKAEAAKVKKSDPKEEASS